MKLICESVHDVKYLVEETEGQKHMYLVGTYLQAGVPNRNRRFYPEPILEREVGRYTQEKIARGNAFGELGHPQGPGLNMDRVSHIITELKKDGLNWNGKARLIGEGMGKIAIGIINAGGTLGMSSRGMGSLKEDKKNGWHEVQDDYRLVVGADIVGDPSAPDAFVNGIMEDAEWFYDAAKGTWAQKAVEPIVAVVHQMTREEREAKAVSIMEGFLARMQVPVWEASVADLSHKSGLTLDAVARARAKAKAIAAREGHAGDEAYVQKVLHRMVGA